MLDSIRNGNDPYKNNQSAIFDIVPNYPSCAAIEIQPSEAWLTNFVIINGGGITISNRTIASTQNGMILSGDYVRLTSGVRITHGANVHIAIKDIDCENSSPDNAPLRHTSRTKKDNDSNKNTNVHNQFAVMPNPVKDILSFSSTEDLTQIYIYSLNGQCVLQAWQTDIDVSALPQGMYILHALTASGTIWQAKFVKE